MSEVALVSTSITKRPLILDGGYSNREDCRESGYSKKFPLETFFGDVWLLVWGYSVLSTYAFERFFSFCVPWLVMLFVP